ncbi:ROK family protein [Anaerofilum sp. BX8]|uniref:ROK family protein n=1 Tax=Anaerofilum hominis TaxID=2763016 RepID=A0A923KY99_9FIRM|nr:ROK family protein [Anaerofilum hominis]MBC5581724.1 ROK family protein [Anaerofilum hominis]
MSILLHHHEVTLNMTDLHYNCVAHWSSGPVRLLCMDMMWEQIRRGAREIMERYPDSRVLGICFPVPLGYTTEKRLSAATPFPAWPRSDFGRSLTEPLQEIFPDARDIIITSDGKAAGSALLHWDFSRYGQGEVATFYCSTGIGGALFRDGQPTTGTKSLVGALGHIIVEPDDPEPCPCGGHGCLERMVSSGRMRERLAAQEEEYRKSCLKEIPVAEMTFEKLFEGSAKGDVLCRRESRYYAQIFSIAIRGLIVSVAPEYVVFQGNFGKADEVFRRELLNKVFEFKYMDRQEKIEFVYDDRDLSMEETVGATYQMINNFLCFPEKYVWKQENVGRALTLPE